MRNKINGSCNGRNMEMFDEPGQRETSGRHKWHTRFGEIIRLR